MNKEGRNETLSLKLHLLKAFILNSQAYVKLIAPERPVRKELNNLGMRWCDLEYDSGRQHGRWGRRERSHEKHHGNQKMTRDRRKD